MVAQSPATSENARGALCGLAAVSIWAGFIVVARLGADDGSRFARIIHRQHAV
jgi:hypothetical protein